MLFGPMLHITPSVETKSSEAPPQTRRDGSKNLDSFAHDSGIQGF